MSNYHPLYHKIWEDHKFLDYSPHQQLIFIYLVSNANCRISGIYEISPRTISCSTNIELERVKELLLTFDEETLSYDFNSGTVFVKNFFKYNLGKMGNARVIQHSLINNLRIIPHTQFWNDFNERYKEELGKLKTKVEGFKNKKKKEAVG